MQSELTYKKAWERLEKLVGELESDNIQLETLADKVKEANELIKFCEDKLKRVENEVKEVDARHS